jgi:hypothetical protein
MPDPTGDLVQRVEGDTVTWIEIASCATIEEANLMKGFLDAEGIPAQIENVQAEILPANFGMLGDIRMYVSSQDEARAFDLLAKRETEYDKLDDDGETIVTDAGVTEVDDNSTVEPDGE